MRDQWFKQMFLAIPMGVALYCMPASASEWQYEELYNPIDQANVYLASVGASDAQMTIRCSALYPQAEIRISLPHGEVDRVAEVHWRFDKRPAALGQWERSANGRDLVVPKRHAAKFARHLRAYQTLYMDVMRTDDELAQYALPLDGSAGAIKRLSANCRF